MRVGLGFDSHPFEEGKPLRLGGVLIPGSPGLQGHSDGDALLHAITDALLGAAGAGSIGERFPDDDPKWKDADSALFVEQARRIAAGGGLRIENVDAIVIAESPRIAPHAREIRETIARLLGIESDRVGVRGTSSNGLGFVGRREGIAAMAVLLLSEQPGSGRAIS